MATPRQVTKDYARQKDTERRAGSPILSPGMGSSAGRDAVAARDRFKPDALETFAECQDRALRIGRRRQERPGA